MMPLPSLPHRPESSLSTITPSFRRRPESSPSMNLEFWTGLDSGLRRNDGAWLGLDSGRRRNDGVRKELDSSLRHNDRVTSSIGAAFGAFMSRKARQCLCFTILFCAFVSNITAQTPTPAMPPMAIELELRLKKLETELRCLVCQNQTLADSPAGLAGDLRREIRLLADENKSNEQIKQHLRARYGDFILYNPPVDGKNYLLWFGPFALLFGGAMLLWVMNRGRREGAKISPPAAVDAEVLARAKALLKDE